MVNVAEAFAIAVQHHQAGRLDEAEHIYRQLLERSPKHPAVLHYLGLLAHQRGNHEEAVKYVQESVELMSDSTHYLLNLVTVLQAVNRIDDALAACRKAIELQPDLVDAHYKMGLLLSLQRRRPEALNYFRQAIALKPDHPDALFQAGLMLQRLQMLDEAAMAYRQSLEIRPNNAYTCMNLVAVYKDLGRMDEAYRYVKRAIELQPDNAAFKSSELFSLHFLPRTTPEELAAAHANFDRRFAQQYLPSQQSFPNDKSPNRRLRLGYVSPDLHRHPIGRFMLPLLAHHDHDQFEVNFYSSLKKPDDVTEQCRAYIDVWRDVDDLSDADLATRIREDQIDILVDLSMHTGKNRLLVFARKPAPVQVTYLAYCSTSGLKAMDYRLTDPYIDPTAHDRSYYSEQSIVLPETFWCYRPLKDAPDCQESPATRAGYVTFGCLNNLHKMSPAALDAWGKLLLEVPTAKLMLLSSPGSHRGYILEFFERLGISPDRIVPVTRTTVQEYFEFYHQMDIALDPFPFGGGTTTCDAIWMGVPVISLIGKTGVGRGGFSILSNIGLAEFAANDVPSYIAQAKRLAEDLPRLRELRSTLRQRMQSSPLCDEPRFAKNVEAAYRNMWQRYCDGK